jgi:hypothetical protein
VRCWQRHSDEYEPNPYTTDSKLPNHYTANPNPYIPNDYSQRDDSEPNHHTTDPSIDNPYTELRLLRRGWLRLSWRGWQRLFLNATPNPRRRGKRGGMSHK